MKIICDKEKLVSAVANVSRAVSSKSPIAALEGILIKAQQDTVTLTGYDLEMGIMTTIEATVQEAGEIVLSAKLLFDMIRRIPSDTISIATDEKLLTLIKGGVTEYTILGMPCDEYPELPAVHGENNLVLPEGTLKSMIDQTLFAVATTDSKPVHTGSLFDIKGDHLNVVSVDGYRLAMRSEKTDCGLETRFIVPGKTLSEVAKLIKEEDRDVELVVSRKHIVFNVAGYSVISRLLEGEFLDYQSAIPKGGTTIIQISTREFTESIERTSLLISDRLRSPLRIHFDDNRIFISCSTAIGKAYDEITCKMDGGSVEMGFNNKYLLDALKASGCDEVKLMVSGPLSPMKIVPLEGESFLFLVLPVRLKGE